MNDDKVLIFPIYTARKIYTQSDWCADPFGIVLKTAYLLSIYKNVY